ncbi:alpha/beta fold hydrolase [Aquabacterium fontiphilum]|jgi:alpha/beta superfamily hydrolase|uniref:alpha/beta hydrolase n=1 Tax=Aquabacterium fontiphilum TaxID=450365 RepID=UPI001376CC44|nr:alpha/beta fold hydrolase [Aquabacterium fontiphilum]NBD21129.1 alpha/beta fold hydrolase [Aquabacterium fontiphilum]
MIGRPASTLIDGPAGPIEIVVESPDAAPLGLAVVAHPHPLMGGTMDNKVVHTLSRAHVAAGWTAVRFNFRGVGHSGGAHDDGVGETDDLLAVLQHHLSQSPWQGRPWALAGFSFGGFVAARAAEAMAHHAPAVVSLVSPATSRFNVPVVPAATLVVQGEADDVVPLASVLDWARPQALPVTVVPGAGHFFHGQLPLLRQIVGHHLRAQAPGVVAAA